MGQPAYVSALLMGLLLMGCSHTYSTSSEDRALSRFAQKIQRQLDRATDPAVLSDADAASLAYSVHSLQRRRSELRATIDDGSPVDRTRERVSLIRIERQLEMVNRLLTRYEQNAPAVASGS